MANIRRTSTTVTTGDYSKPIGNLLVKCEEPPHILAKGRPRLLRFEELPDWLRDNPHVQTGYRPVLNSARKCFDSLFYLHNETINIYSHLLPAGLASALCLFGDYFFQQRYPDAYLADRLVFAFYAFTVMTAMGLSATFHMFCCHSESFADFWLKSDYFGIMLLTFGNFWSGIYVDFYCEPHLQRTYWSMITIFTGITAVVVLNPMFNSRRYRLLRLICFAVTGMSAFLPIIHSLFLFPAEDLAKQSGVNHYLTEGGILALAAIVYGARLPESLFPGTFDLFGASHQIFHVLVVASAVAHFQGIKTAFEYNYHEGRC